MAGSSCQSARTTGPKLPHVPFVTAGAFLPLVLFFRVFSLSPSASLTAPANTSVPTSVSFSSAACSSPSVSSSNSATLACSLASRPATQTPVPNVLRDLGVSSRWSAKAWLSSWLDAAFTIFGRALTSCFSASYMKSQAMAR